MSVALCRESPAWYLGAETLPHPSEILLDLAEVEHLLRSRGAAKDVLQALLTRDTLQNVAGEQATLGVLLRLQAPGDDVQSVVADAHRGAEGQCAPRAAQDSDGPSREQRGLQDLG